MDTVIDFAQSIGAVNAVLLGREKMGLRTLCLVGLMIVLVGCQEQHPATKTVPREVSVRILAPSAVSLSVELSGRVSAYKKAEVRPQVGGILHKQLFSEGSLVGEGQSLYKIDPAMYEAEVESAKAALARAQATLQQALLRRDRRKSLLGSRAVSKQDMEDAEASYLQAKADVDVAKAALATAQIRLRYTDVLAPITGRIGKSNVTQGALVTANQGDPLAVIHQLDPVYVDMTRSSLELLKLRDRYVSGRLQKIHAHSTPVRLMVDETPYPHEGHLQFADISVDESTGMVLLRAVFPNPDGTLLPGLYVKAQVFEGVHEEALLVPEIAVQRSARGEASVFCVDANERVVRKAIEVGERTNRDVVVVAGLREGDRVIVAGLRGLREGDRVVVREQAKGL